MGADSRHFPPYPDFSMEISRNVLTDTRGEDGSETDIAYNSSWNDSNCEGSSTSLLTKSGHYEKPLKKNQVDFRISTKKASSSFQNRITPQTSKTRKPLLPDRTNKAKKLPEISKPRKIKPGSYVYFKLKKEVESKVDELISKLYDSIMDAIPGMTGVTSDYSLYTGYTGIAYVNYLLFKKTRDRAYFKVAKDLVNKAITSLKGRRISFLNGDAGPLALGAVLNILEENETEADSLIDRLIKLGDTPDNSLPDEILYGRAGYLYALLFIDQETRPIIPEMILRKHVEKILQSGSKEAAKRRSIVPLYYEWHDKIYLGAAHGYAGILYILLIASRYMTEFELDKLVRPTLEWLINTKFSSYNFPSSIGSSTDRLVQWCHGAPGFTLLLSLASQVYKSPRYKELALECGDVVWERGLLKKGYSICHGISGNGYTFLHLYQMTRDIRHLYRAASYIEWCTRYPANEGMRPDRPFSLFEGRAGLLYFLVDSKDPLRSSFPCFELKLSV